MNSLQINAEKPVSYVKWVLLSVIFIPLAYVSVRVTRLARRLLTLRKIAFVMGLWLCWRYFPQIEAYFGEIGLLAFVPKTVTSDGHEVLVPAQQLLGATLGLLVALSARLLPMSRRKMRKRAAFIEAKIANLKAHPFHPYGFRSQENALRKLTNRRDALKVELRFS